MLHVRPPLPVSHPEQLVQVNMAGRDIWDMEDPFVSNPVWEQLRQANLRRFRLARAGEGLDHTLQIELGPLRLAALEQAIRQRLGESRRPVR